MAEPLSLRNEVQSVSQSVSQSLCLFLCQRFFPFVTVADNELARYSTALSAGCQLIHL